MIIDIDIANPPKALIDGKLYTYTEYCIANDNMVVHYLGAANGRTKRVKIATDIHEVSYKVVQDLKDELEAKCIDELTSALNTR